MERERNQSTVLERSSTATDSMDRVVAQLTVHAIIADKPVAVV